MDKFTFNALLREIDDGSQAALERLYDEYGKLVMWLAYSVLKDWHHCQDVLDIVMIRIWNNSEKIKKINNPTAYMQKVALNTTYSYYKSHISEDKKHLVCEDTCKDEGKEDVYGGNEKSDFMELIKELSESEQQVVFMKVYCNDTFDDIAKVLHMPKATVLWIYNRAIEKLKQLRQRPPR